MITLNNGNVLMTEGFDRNGVTAAADRAAELVRQMPAPRPVSLTAYTGTPVRYQLTADIAAGFTLLWEAASSGSLPPGLAMAGTGLITGTPTTVGTYNTPVLVRSVRAHLASPWLPATLESLVFGPSHPLSWGAATVPYPASVFHRDWRHAGRETG